MHVTVGLACAIINLLHHSFCGRLGKHAYFETECVLAVHGHPMLFSLVRIESAYATSYSSSIAPVTLPRFRDIAGFLLKQMTLPAFHPNFGAFLLDQITDLGAPRSEDAGLIVREIISKYSNPSD